MAHPISIDDFRAIRNWLQARYLRDPVPDLHPLSLPGSESDPYRLRAGIEFIVYERFEPFAEFLVELAVDVSVALKLCKSMGWVEDIPVIIGKDEDIQYDSGIQCLMLPVGRHRLIRILSGVCRPLPNFDPEPPRTRSSGVSKIAQAIALKRRHPDMTDKAVAEKVECDPSTLSGSPDYRAARDALAAEQAKRLNRARRNRGNSDMDEYSDDSDK